MRARCCAVAYVFFISSEEISGFPPFPAIFNCKKKATTHKHKMSDMKFIFSAKISCTLKQALGKTRKKLICLAESADEAGKLEAY